MRLRSVGMAIALLWLSGSQASAQYPSRPITLVVPFSAGSGSDVVARLIAAEMGKSLNQTFVIENKPGAGGNIGARAVVAAKPDGYTVLLGTLGNLAANKTLMTDIGYDPEKDFDPISMIGAFPMIAIVNSVVPVNSLGELTAYARAHPKKLNYGSVGLGSGNHLAGAFYASIIDAQMTHVAYKSAMQLLSETAKGEIHLTMNSVGNLRIIENQAPGKIKALAVASTRRLEDLPDVPTAAEAGLPEFQVATWFAFVAPRGTPKDVIQTFHKHFSAVMGTDDMRKKLQQQGMVPGVTSPAETSAFISSEVKKWREVITKEGITAN